jgi:hypothetical protein
MCFGFWHSRDRLLPVCCLRQMCVPIVTGDLEPAMRLTMPMGCSNVEAMGNGVGDGVEGRRRSGTRARGALPLRAWAAGHGPCAASARLVQTLDPGIQGGFDTRPTTMSTLPRPNSRRPSSSESPPSS